MKLYVNEKVCHVDEGATAFSIKQKMKPDADIVIVNGFIISQDLLLCENDRAVFIKKGEIPDKNELEHLMAARHTPGVHEKVKKAVVGIAGLGGLGSNVAIALARIGVGKLILVDYDVVEPSNLNRQQYFVSHLGMYKTEAIKQLLSNINPYIQLETRNMLLKAENIVECFSEADIIVEAFDNPFSKAELANIVLSKMPQKIFVAASGMAGYGSNNTITTKRINSSFYLVGDSISEAKPGSGLMAPRVAIAANHQANTVLRLIMGEKEI